MRWELVLQQSPIVLECSRIWPPSVLPSIVVIASFLMVARLALAELRHEPT